MRGKSGCDRSTWSWQKRWVYNTLSVINDLCCRVETSASRSSVVFRLRKIFQCLVRFNGPRAKFRRDSYVKSAFTFSDVLLCFHRLACYNASAFLAFSLDSLSMCSTLTRAITLRFAAVMMRVTLTMILCTQYHAGVQLESVTSDTSVRILLCTSLRCICTVLLRGCLPLTYCLESCSWCELNCTLVSKIVNLNSDFTPKTQDCGSLKIV